MKESKSSIGVKFPVTQFLDEHLNAAMSIQFDGQEKYQQLRMFSEIIIMKIIYISS